MKDKSYEEKLKEYFDKYGADLDADTTSFILKMNLSDMIFQQHMYGCYKLNMAMIIIQFIAVLVGLIASVFGYHITDITCTLSIIILIFVLANNKIHNIAWKKAKETLSNLEVGIDILQVNSKMAIINELKNKYGINVEQYIKDDIESEE